MISTHLVYILFFLCVTRAQVLNKIAVKVYQGNTSATLLSAVDIYNHMNLTEIVIEDEELPILTTNFFHGLSNLYGVFIRRTSLRLVEDNAFRNLPRLRLINLNFNHIDRISDKTFNNPKLTNIALKANGIKSISSKAFNNLPNLRYLDLSSNNIQDIPKDAFKRTGNLKVLNLSYNKLRHYPAIPYRPYSYFEQAFANAVKHEPTSLDLSFNNFTFISYYLLRGIRFIDELKLNDNNINLISDYAFDDLKYAKVLNLENNDLKQLSLNLLFVLEGVEELKMENNRWSNEFVCKYEDWCRLCGKVNSMDVKCYIGNKFKDVRFNEVFS